jgi:hypothetical protein
MLGLPRPSAYKVGGAVPEPMRRDVSIVDRSWTSLKDDSKLHRRLFDLTMAILPAIKPALPNSFERKRYRGPVVIAQRD